MARAVEKFKSELEELPQEDQAELAYFLLERLGPEESGTVELFDDQLARRVAEIQEGRAQGRPAEEVLADWRRRQVE